MKTSTVYYTDRGMLNSTYKAEIRKGFCRLTSKSLSRVKRTVFNQHDRFVGATVTTLKIAVFALVITGILL